MNITLTSVLAALADNALISLGKKVNTIILEYLQYGKEKEAPGLFKQVTQEAILHEELTNSRISIVCCYSILKQEALDPFHNMETKIQD
jgi:hypothetical protein